PEGRRPTNDMQVVDHAPPSGSREERRRPADERRAVAQHPERAARSAEPSELPEEDGVTRDRHEPGGIVARCAESWMCGTTPKLPECAVEFFGSVVTSSRSA